MDFQKFQLEDLSRSRQLSTKKKVQNRSSITQRRHRRIHKRVKIITNLVLHRDKNYMYSFIRSILKEFPKTEQPYSKGKFSFLEASRYH